MDRKVSGISPDRPIYSYVDEFLSSESCGYKPNRSSRHGVVNETASLIIENHENTSSILFSEFEKYSKSGSKSDELEKFSEFKVTGILSCFFKAIGKGSLSLRNTLSIKPDDKARQQK